jgi:hypothetical protein
MAARNRLGRLDRRLALDWWLAFRRFLRLSRQRNGGEGRRQRNDYSGSTGRVHSRNPPVQRIPICATTGGAPDMQTCFAAFVSLKIGKIAAMLRRHAIVSTVPE